VKTKRGRTDNLPSRFKTFIAQKFYARLHMTLILGAVAVSGVVLSKLLLELGVKSILARYVTAVVFSYSLFFLFIRIWLWYVSQDPAPFRGRGEIDLPEDIGFDSVNGGGDIGPQAWTYPPTQDSRDSVAGDFGAEEQPMSGGSNIVSAAA
jgi:hypothetical protein